MHRRAKTTFLAIAAFSLTMAALVSLRPSEPVYRGKPLTQWLAPSLSNPDRGATEWGARSLEADEAVRHVGTNAVPTLLRIPMEHQAKEPDTRAESRRL
jgi:hypothetical protein